jgi:hypothetical protein
MSFYEPFVDAFYQIRPAATRKIAVVQNTMPLAVMLEQFG